MLDDLGAQYERQADDTSRVSWVSEQLYQLLNERVMHNRTTIYTTNLSPTDLQRALSNESGQRVLGRLLQPQIATLEIKSVPNLHDESKSAARELLFATPGA